MTIDPRDRRGTVGLGPDGEVQVRFERRVAHPPDRVWDSLVDPDQQALWAPGVRFTARVGTPVLFDFGDEGRAEGEVLAVHPPRLIEHTATVRWQLEPVEGGTRIVLLHRPLRSGPVMLDALEDHLDGRDPNATPPDFAIPYEMYATG